MFNNLNYTRTALFTIAMFSLSYVHAEENVQLKSVKTQSNTSSTEIKLLFNGIPVTPKAYKIDTPNRLVLDFPSTKNLVNGRVFPVKSNHVKQYTVVNNQDYTRLILDLKTNSQFTSRKIANSLIVKVADKSMLSSRSGSTVKTASIQPKNPLLDTGVAKQNSKKYTIEGLSNVNFRRTDKNTGRVDIVLANSDIPVDVQRKGTKLVVRTLGAKVPKRLRRRMNVSNFDTPVKNIDAFNDGSNGTVIIQPKGEFDYQVYQTDNNLTIEVNPIVKVTKTQVKEKKYTGKPLTLDFQDVEVRAVLQLLADFTNLNLVASDNVGGRMTLRLHNVPWDQALDIILKSKSLGMRKNGNVVMIAPASEIAAQDQSTIKSKQQIKDLAPVRTEYVQLNYAKASDMLALIGKNSGKGVNSLLSSKGTVSVDSRTNTLIIQDNSEKIDEIRGLISKLDVPVKQVMIEARIVRASDSFGKELGVKWGLLSNGAANNRNLLVGASENTIWNLKNYTTETSTVDGESVVTPTYTIERPSNLNVDLGVQSGGASKIAFGLLSLPNAMLDLELSALQADGRGEVVATPKVLTADKQKATVASGTQIPYQQATAGGATAVAFINAELSLEVTPSITPEGKVSMQLRVNSDTPGELQANGIRAIDTNRVDTNVLVDDGQTVVLGGIFQNQSSKNVVKTPFLGDLPYVGRFFRRTAVDVRKQELLIFVTPRLVNENINNLNN